jgi:hypothetical protein
MSGDVPVHISSFWFAPGIIGQEMPPYAPTLKVPPPHYL